MYTPPLFKQDRAASAAFASYRAIGGAVSLQPIGSVTHTLSDANGTLSVAELSTSAARELANDVMLTGAEEPAAYIAESFVGDGTTNVFTLSQSAYHSEQRALLRDSFNAATFVRRMECDMKSCMDVATLLFRLTSCRRPTCS